MILECIILKYSEVRLTKDKIRFESKIKNDLPGKLRFEQVLPFLKILFLPPQSPSVNIRAVCHRLREMDVSGKKTL